MNCPNDVHDILPRILVPGSIKGYYTCNNCKTQWYIAKVGETH